jgi:hypothetical protein
MVIEYKNPIRVSEEAIDCEINHKDYGWIPFTCVINDPSPYFNTAELYAIMSKDPSITEIPKPTQEELYETAAKHIRYTRNQLLKSEVDPIISNPLRWADYIDELKQQWVQYRIDLLDITEQEGFPFSVVWPVTPNK